MGLTYYSHVQFEREARTRYFEERLNKSTTTDIKNSGQL